MLRDGERRQGDDADHESRLVEVEVRGVDRARLFPVWSAYAETDHRARHALEHVRKIQYRVDEQALRAITG